MKLHYLIITMVAGVILLAGSAAPTSAQKNAAPKELSAAERDELLKFRESVWRDFFAGDKAKHEKALPENFIGIGWNAGRANRFSSRPSVLAGAEGFLKSGGKLTRLEFPETKIQVYGDVAILYTTFDLDLEAGGQKTNVKGHGTEIFVRENGKWIHPGWHLDNY